MKNLGPIKNGSMRPSSGLTAITGETGAGKSMLLSAVELITGRTTPRRSIPDAGETVVQGVFEFEDDDETSEAYKKAAELDAIEDNEMIVTRTVKPSGRSRIKANGIAMSRKTIAGLAEDLVVIHGQNDQIRLTEPGHQLSLLDEYAGDHDELANYREAYSSRLQKETFLKSLESPETMRRVAQLKQDIRRIKKAEIKEGEYDQLVELLDDAEDRREKTQVYSAASLMLSGEDSPVDAIREVYRDICDLLDEDLGSRFGDAINVLDEVADVVQSSLESEEDVDVDAIESRINELDRIRRLYGSTEQEIFDYLDNAKAKLKKIDVSPEHVEELKAELEAAVDDEAEKAAVLTKRRVKAALELAKAVNAELEGLNMAGASIDIVRTEAAPSQTGHDKFSFLFSSHPTATPREFSQSASGGELSRLSLALELSLASRHPSRDLTFVFDEIDAGVGAATGFELGRRIARLAESSQVIIVTHLAQVASWADSQYEVSKTDGMTTIRRLDHDGRVDAISKMFDGDLSELGREHAEKLLERSHL